MSILSTEDIASAGVYRAALILPEKGLLHTCSGSDCRMSEQGQTELQDLPPDLIDNVMKEIQGVCGFKGLASCRLVSKTWLAAVQQYSGKAGCTANAENLEALCQILPNMASVAVSSDADSATFNLRPLQSCSQLTSIELSAPGFSTGGLGNCTILDLPSTVKEAKFRNIHLAYSSAANSTSSLTRLHYQLDESMFIPHSFRKPTYVPASVQIDLGWDWMQKWQYLEELELVGTHSKWQPFVKEFGQALASLPRLRKLILKEHNFPEQRVKFIKPPLTLSNVRDLRLSSTTLPQEWFDLAFNFLPNLAALRLTCCKYPGAETFMKAETRVLDLKSLNLRWSPPSILHLVGTGLESLQLLLDSEELANIEHFIQKADSLKRLTSLKLYNLKPHTIDTRPLQGLPLRELALHYCQGLELELLVPGTLLSLTSLHIREFPGRQPQVQGQDEMMKELADCGQIVLGLPHLREVSGSSALFSFGMGDELQTWKISHHKDCVRRKPYQSDYPERLKLRVWQRP